MNNFSTAAQISTEALPFDVTPPAVVIDNMAFLETLFPDLPPEDRAWVCTFPGDPHEVDKNSWRGYGVRPAAATALVHRGIEHLNTFCCFAAFSEGGRRKALFRGQYGIMVDDVGTGIGAKIPPDKLPELIPSWILETSPRNWQVGYLLSTPCREGLVAARLIDLLIEVGLQAEEDPGMKGVTRYGRLPVGMNGKALYGGSVAHRLVHWSPSSRYGLDQIAEAYGIEPARLHEAAPAKVRRDVSGPDEWLPVVEKAVARMGPAQDKGPDGIWYDIQCPWIDGHTGAVDNGAAYCEGGGFKCHHGHCQDRNGFELRAWLRSHPDEEVSKAALQVGAEEAFGEDPPADLKRFPGLADIVAKAVDAATKTDFEGLYRENVLRGVAILPAGERETTYAKVKAKGIPIGPLKKEVDKISGKEKRQQHRDRTEGTGLAIILEGSWRDMDEDRNPLPTSRNVEQIIQEMGGWLRYNLMTHKVEYLKGLAGLRGPVVRQRILDTCHVNKLKMHMGAVGDAMTSIAFEHEYHPFEEFLKSIEWDGRDWLGELFATVRIPPERLSISHIAMRKWFYSVRAAARGLKPAPRGVLTFTGTQYSGKTTWFMNLFEDLFEDSGRCFVEGAHLSGDKDSQLLVLGGLVTELGELDSTTRKSDVAMLKAFLSRTMDSIRKPYGREHEDMPRRTVFCGTVNPAEFLVDQTGNTRFWTVPIESIDLERQRRIDMKQVWAQVDAWAGAMVDAGIEYCPWHLSRAEMVKMEAANEEHTTRLPGDDALRDMFDFDDEAWLEMRERWRLDRKKWRAAFVGINGMKVTAILEKLQDAGVRGANSYINVSLKKLTGVDSAIHTTVKGHQGRFWPMPPASNVAKVTRDYTVDFEHVTSASDLTD